MRRKTAGFDGEQKAAWRRVSPVVEGAGSRKVIEAVIDFDGVEVPRVELKHLVAASAGRIENALQPMFVVPPRSADIKLHFTNRITLRLGANPSQSASSVAQLREVSRLPPIYFSNHSRFAFIAANCIFGSVGPCG